MIVILPSFYSKDSFYIDHEQKLELDLLLDGKEDVELVFFGYAGCLAVCTPRLEAIKQWYQTLTEKEQQRVTLRFFDLSIPKDPKVPDIFVKGFHKNFKGIYLNESVLRDYTQAFSVYFSDSLFEDNEIDHSTFLYITKRDKHNRYLKAIYTAYPYDFNFLSSKIRGLLSE